MSLLSIDPTRKPIVSMHKILLIVLLIAGIMMPASNAFADVSVTAGTLYDYIWHIDGFDRCYRASPDVLRVHNYTSGSSAITVLDLGSVPTQPLDRIYIRNRTDVASYLNIGRVQIMVSSMEGLTGFNPRDGNLYDTMVADARPYPWDINPGVWRAVDLSLKVKKRYYAIVVTENMIGTLDRSDVMREFADFADVNIDKDISAYPQPLVQYVFSKDESTGIKVFNSGTLPGANLTMYNSSWVAGDYHGAEYTGPSGYKFDRTFNCTSGAMAGNGFDARTAGSVPGLNGLESFTMAGWFKCAGYTLGASKPVVLSRNTGTAGMEVRLGAYNSGTGNYSLQCVVDGHVYESSASYPANQWVLFEVTWDGTQANQPCSFYKGTVSNAVSLVNTVTYSTDLGLTNTNSNPVLVSNAYVNFKGNLAQMAIWGKTSGNGGVLSSTDREAYRRATLLLDELPKAYNTGIYDDRTLLPGGAVDGHYLLTDAWDPNRDYLKTWVRTTLPGGWLANNSTSKWLSPLSDSFPNAVYGYYTFRTTFNLDEFIPNTARVVGNCAVDDYLYNLFLDMNATGFTCSGFSQWSQFDVSSGFLPGVNTLEFQAFNAVASPAGLRVEMLNPTAMKAGTPPLNTETFTSVSSTSYSNGTVYMNGSPFLPRVIYHVECRPDYKNQGFNLVHCWPDGTTQTEIVNTMLARLNAAQASGMWGILYFGNNTFFLSNGNPRVFNTTNITNVLNTNVGGYLLKDHPALFGIELADEPDVPSIYISPAEMARASGVVRSVDPDHLIITNLSYLYPNSYDAYLGSQDVWSFDLYPFPININDNMLNTQVAGTASYYDWISKSDTDPNGGGTNRLRGNRPLGTCLQAYNNSGLAPTPAEFRASAYEFIIHDYRWFATYSFYEPDPNYSLDNSPELNEYMRRFNAELLALKPVILDTAAFTPVSFNGVKSPLSAAFATRDFDVARKTVGGVTYLIAVNGVNYPARVNMTGLTGFTEAEALFENGRTKSISGGTLTDDFVPFGVHVYLLR